MRVAPVFLLIAAPFCFAQTISIPDHACAASRILTPSDAFPMPLAKTPNAQTVKGGVISTVPPCVRAEPKPLMAKRIQIQTPHVKPGHLELLPNPFTPLTK